MTALSSAEVERIGIRLAQFRDQPPTTENLSEADLTSLFNFLVKQSQASHGPIHWYCSKANPVLVEAATFLIRLHAYSGIRVKEWKIELERCLLSCTDCVAGLLEARVTSRHTYFGAFSEKTLAAFYKSFNNQLVEFIFTECRKAQLLPDQASQTGRTLADLPPSLAYLMVGDVEFTQNSKIMGIIYSHVPNKPIQGWPLESVPAGLLVLLMEKTPEVRAWASSQLSLCTRRPMSTDHFLTTYSDALELCTTAITQPDPYNTGLFSDDLQALWQGYSTILGFVPSGWLYSSKDRPSDVRLIVIRHLSDVGPHFMEVLKTFLIVLDRLGPTTWIDESDEYPQVVFNTIKDNTSYSALLQGLPADRDWAIKWMEGYVKSIGNLAVFPNVMPLIIQYLCEELQHERYEHARSVAIVTASRLLHSILFDKKGQKEQQTSSLAPVEESLDIHANIFVSVAFGRAYSDNIWSEAREAARKLIKASLSRDVVCIITTIATLAKSSSKESPIPVPSIRTQIWKKTYESILPNESYGIATVLEILAPISHVDNLLPSAFGKLDSEGQNALHGVNRALVVIRSGFSDSISRYLDFTDSTSILDVLGKPNMAKNVMLLMFSPVESLREPAQAIVGLAMDVESRPDCFRAVISNFPAAAMEGMMRFLKTYTKYAPCVPEACSLSKALALCFTDILDVLCSNPDGLLHRTTFLQAMGDRGPTVQLPEWWSLMSEALSVIFRYSKTWSPLFENSEMVTWMRDAVIFGRDMLAQRRVIESAALATSIHASTGRSISQIGKKMVGDLQGALFELTAWLRLTDEELLYQSFALLQSLLGCFKEAKIDPRERTLDKLDRLSRQDAESKGKNTKLDRSRLNILRNVIGEFDKAESSDDEVQIVKGYVPPKQSKPGQKPQISKQIASGSAVVQQSLTSAAARSKTKSEKIAYPSKLKPGLTAVEQRKLDSSSTVPKFNRPTVKTASTVTGPSGRPEAATVAAPPPRPASDKSESSSEGEGGTFEGLAKLQDPTIRKPERRQVKMLEEPWTTGRNAVLDRIKRSDAEKDALKEARYASLRLKPDVTALHRDILSWDYNHSGSQPPGPSLRLQRVPDRFDSSKQFEDVFQPLLLMECWAQLQQSKDEAEESYNCRIVGRQYTDEWIDMEITIPDVVQKDWYLSDTDIVLLRHPTNNICHLMKVQSFKASPHPQGLQATLRMNNRSNSGPQTSTEWRLTKVFSLTTLHREFGALKAMPYYGMRDRILKSTLKEVGDPDPSELRKTMKLYSLNEPQAKAILNALRTDGFSLIQGPPGTGKTSTICGLVQAFLSKRPKPVTIINPGRDVSHPPKKEISQKILLCAPSNAAIDEITYRLKEGMSGPGQQLIAPKVVRVGNPRSMNVSVKDVSLDYLTEQKLNAEPGAKKATGDAGTEMARLRAELESVKRARLEKINEKDSIHDNTIKTLALDNEIRKLQQRTRTLGIQLDRLRDQRKSDSRAMDALSRRCRAEVLQEADVICATLAGSGHEMLEPFDFGMVVIDEAAQAIELSSLIPLKYSCDRCVMVGDPKQLPPTVISQEASKYGYNQSLFVRLHKAREDAAHLLSIQYRMHPEISVLPSRLFYDGRLLNGPDMVAKTQKPWHASPKFGPYRFYNVAKGFEEKGRFHSLTNKAEAHLAVALFNRLRQEYSSYNFDFKVGIVTMYRAQVSELRRAFEQRFGNSITGTVDFNTVDGFQGQEKEIIILSCVRAGNIDTVGFLADKRRMNVALTRAKSSVFVLGNAATLERDTTWRSIVDDARERACLVDADVSFFTTPYTSGPSPSVPKPVKAPPPPRAKPVLPPASAPPPVDLFPLGRKKLPSPTKDSSAATTPQRATDQPNMSVGQKRPAEDTPAPLPAPAIRAQAQPQPQPPRPQHPQPPPKPKAKPPKPKQPRSIFMPSKRPLPQDRDDEAGPSTSRRRF